VLDGRLGVLLQLVHLLEVLHEQVFEARRRLGPGRRPRPAADPRRVYVPDESQGVRHAWSPQARSLSPAWIICLVACAAVTFASYARDASSALIVSVVVSMFGYSTYPSPSTSALCPGSHTFRNGASSSRISFTCTPSPWPV